jgi:colanic acid biosynthesis protein WcaH
MEKSVYMHNAIKYLDEAASDKRNGLPDDIFYFISRTTPLVNVDLLIKDKMGRILLSYRNDEYCGKGWHIIGGIVRFKETLFQRIQNTAINELGSIVAFEPKPVAILENIIENRENRAHHISFLYNCTVPENYVINNGSKRETDAGFLKWHKKFPDNIISCQISYKQYFESKGDSQ